jgi:hypothetical protein
MQITVKSNIDILSRQIRSYRNQIPQATAAALTKTAFDIRQEIVQNTWPRSVTVRNSRFMNAALRVKNATKRMLTASIFDSLSRNYLARLESSGTKTPLGNNIAIPARDVEGLIRGGGGAVKKAYKPRNLLNKNRFFRTTLKSGMDAIVERPAGKEAGIRKTNRLKRGPLKVWYLLEPKAHIPKLFPFYEAARRVVDRRFALNFRNAFRRAVMTRR